MLLIGSIVGLQVLILGPHTFGFVVKTTKPIANGLDWKRAVQTTAASRTEPEETDITQCRKLCILFIRHDFIQLYCRRCLYQGDLLSETLPLLKLNFIASRSYG